ncbi:MAG TPA: hypothetical protein VFX01_06210 [Methylophilaceae bacterium]|nr:hypothetical protein [Methylophilaceae bacterium]
MAIANWLALLLAPSLALTTLTVNYAAVTHTCEQQGGGELHIVAGISLVLSLTFTFLAWRNTRRQQDDKLPQADRLPQDDRLTKAEPSRTRGRQHFVAKVAALVGLLSSLAIIALWLPVWVLSPCIA